MPSGIGRDNGRIFVFNLHCNKICAEDFGLMERCLGNCACAFVHAMGVYMSVSNGIFSWVCSGVSANGGGQCFGRELLQVHQPGGHGAPSNLGGRHGRAQRAPSGGWMTGRSIPRQKLRSTGVVGLFLHGQVEYIYWTHLRQLCSLKLLFVRRTFPISPCFFSSHTLGPTGGGNCEPW